MRGRRRAQSGPVPSSPMGPMVWLRADYEFPSTFSYRMPKVSAQFAIGSPIPSPATVKLALVDAAIRWKGKVDEGERIFNLLKTAKVCVVPPPRMVRFRAFIKRLKPNEVVACRDHPDYTVSAKLGEGKRPPCPYCGKVPQLKMSTLEESTGVRDYFLLEGPLTVFIKVPQFCVNDIYVLLQRIRRFGTSDSLCYCICVVEAEPPAELCPRAFDDARPDTGGFVSVLADLTSESEFDGFNPFGGDQELARQDIRPYILPLTVRRSGETWAILERTGPSI